MNRDAVERVVTTELNQRELNIPTERLQREAEQALRGNSTRETNQNYRMFNEMAAQAHLPQLDLINDLQSTAPARADNTAPTRSETNNQTTRPRTDGVNAAPAPNGTDHQTNPPGQDVVNRAPVRGGTDHQPKRPGHDVVNAAPVGNGTDHQTGRPGHEIVNAAPARNETIHQTHVPSRSDGQRVAPPAIPNHDGPSPTLNF